MRNATIALATFALLLARSAAPQEAAPTPQPDSTFGEQVEVTEVLLDAVVTDGDGNVIVGLGPNDFKVEEDGKPVTLTDVRFYSSRARLDYAGRPVNPAEAQRLFVLFFHDQRSLNTEVPGVLARALDASRRAKDWVRKLGPQDYVAVASWEHSLIVEQDFTRDRKAMERAIAEAATGADPRGNWPSRLPADEGPSLLKNLPKGNAVRDSTPTIYEALQVLAKASAQVVGRKNLVLFSSGFGDVNSFGQFQPDVRYDQPTVQILNDSNVAVYAVDVLDPNTESPLGSALSLLATETGGRYFQHVVNFVTPLSEIASETTGYYLLSYRATHPRGQDGYQKVKVAVTNPGLRVKAREGYRYGD
ncbi:MAG TPA: VWA domain-containing protein [Thermoanaerobaculia bacterium]|nr:VWA domain-containing protein [Thermoanaerobaculia bacterium]